MNGHSGRSSRGARRYKQDSDGASSAEQDGDVGTRRLLKRRTARAAVNKIKLLEALDEDFEEEKQPTRSSSRLRHTARSGKRAAVIQSSSESDQEQSTQSRKRRRMPYSCSTPRNSFLLSAAVYFSLAASPTTKESGDDSRGGGGDDSDASGSSHYRANGDVRPSKQRPSRPAAKTKTNGERRLHLPRFLFCCECQVSHASLRYMNPQTPRLA